jgi:hypothetical protein
MPTFAADGAVVATLAVDILGTVSAVGSDGTCGAARDGYM